MTGELLTTAGLVFASSRADKVLENSFDHSGGAVKLVQACLSTSEDLESSFTHVGSPVKPVQACMFERVERSIKQFPLLWWCCKTRTDQFHYKIDQKNLF